jgi:hypothetical protein
MPVAILEVPCCTNNCPDCILGINLQGISLQGSNIVVQPDAGLRIQNPANGKGQITVSTATSAQNIGSLSNLNSLVMPSHGITLTPKTGELGSSVPCTVDPNSVPIDVVKLDGTELNTGLIGGHSPLIEQEAVFNNPFNAASV